MSTHKFMCIKLYIICILPIIVQVYAHILYITIDFIYLNMSLYQ